MTALLCWKDILYVGTAAEGGVMLALNPVDMTALWTFHATETPIRLLLGTLLNPKEELKPHNTQPPTLQGQSDSVEDDKPNDSPNRGTAKMSLVSLILDGWCEFGCNVFYNCKLLQMAAIYICMSRKKPSSK